MSIPPGYPYPQQQRFGPYTKFLQLGLILAEGQLYQATVVAPDGTAYTFILTGGHDLENKTVGACGQTCQGEPTFQAPAGCSIYDTTNQVTWVSNGWTGGVPANGIDSPSEGMITATNFLGWVQEGAGAAGIIDEGSDW